ncbi:hypothetical protein DDT91_07905 [Algoriphagus sp. AK58]|nr:hypothetical protein [Algoriphagus sp. AK58]
MQTRGNEFGTQTWSLTGSASSAYLMVKLQNSKSEHLVLFLKLVTGARRSLAKVRITYPKTPLEAVLIFSLPSDTYLHLPFL